MGKMGKRKIAVLLHGLGPNGIDTLFANLADKWDYNTFDVTYFLAVDADDYQFWENKVSLAGVRIVHLTDLDGKKLLCWPKVLNRALKEYGPFDAIHVNMDMLNGINLAIARINHIPVRICHAHVSGHKLPQNKMKLFIKRVYLFVMKTLIRNLSTMRIACSNDAGLYFYGNNDFEVVFNGIDIGKFTSVAKRKSDFNEKIRIITVGRISYPKNPYFIADVINELYKRDRRVEFTWVGSGEMEGDVKQYISKLDIRECVSFLGTRTDIAEVLASADYFLFPSLYEGMGIVVIEAQAAGLMCFASDAVPKVVNCGKCRFISLTKKADEWADIILQTLRDRQSSILDTEKLSQFELANMARRLEQLYRGEL